jgi:hypothetical protein
MSNVWLASNSAPANQMATIQRQPLERSPVRISIMAVTVRQRITGAKSLMQ